MPSAMFHWQTQIPEMQSELMAIAYGVLQNYDGTIHARRAVLSPPAREESLNGSSVDPVEPCSVVKLCARGAIVDVYYRVVSALFP